MYLILLLLCLGSAPSGIHLRCQFVKEPNSTKSENASVLILFLLVNGLFHCLLGSTASIKRYAGNTLVNLLTHRCC